MIGVAVLVVIAISVGITLVVTRDGSGPGGTTTTAAPPNARDIASADDTGPVSLITADPTCSAWISIQKALANVERNGWGERDWASESSSWSPQVRAEYDAVGAAMRGAADQAIGLAKQTPHRVMREMYEQFIAYGRAYANSLSSYRPLNNELSLVNVNLADAIAGVCNAVEYGAIAARASSVRAAESPSAESAVINVDDPSRFVAGTSNACVGWIKANSTTSVDLGEWGALDRSIPATAWPTERMKIEQAAARTFGSYATTIEELGRKENSTFEDFAALAALYLRAYAATTPTYTVQDSYIATPGLRLNSAVNAACKASAD